MKKPYVVSADIYLLMKVWAAENVFVLPEKKFFSYLRAKFIVRMQKMFSNFELVSEEEISFGLSRLVAQGGLPVVSLDRIYFQGELNLEVTRLVNKEGKDQGLGNRARTPTISQQLRQLQLSGFCKVAVVDDVLFSGGLLEKVIKLLSGINICVPVFYGGIGITEGIKNMNDLGVEVRCVRTYEEVIDEVCERDFYPGVPMSGRLLDEGSNISVPYILPFGNPKVWASIPPQHSTAFSKFCLNQTIMLFDEIERCSGKKILCQDLGRKVVGIPADETQFTKVLRKLLHDL